MPKSKTPFFIYGFIILVACCSLEASTAPPSSSRLIDLGPSAIKKTINGKDFQIDLQKTEDSKKNMIVMNMTIRNDSDDTRFLHLGRPLGDVRCLGFPQNKGVLSAPEINQTLQNIAWQKGAVRLEPQTTLNVSFIFAPIRKNEHFESFILNERTQKKTKVELFDDD